MLFKLIYECFYFGISLANKFDEIKAFIIFKPILFGFNRFNVIKKAIEKSLLNECIIKIIIKKAIYIGFIKPGFEIITRKKEIELFDLLRKVEIGSLLIKDRRFLKKAHELCKAKEIRVWKGIIKSIEF